MADAHKNFAYSTVATAPSPATSGTSLVVATGDGAKFPAVPFYATIWPVSTLPTTANAEIVRVTAISTDTLTITRTQESTLARTVIVGDQIAQTVTAAGLEQYVPLSGGTLTGTLATQALTASAGYTYDLGTSGAPFNNIWAGFSLNVQASGINTEIVAGANGSNQILTLPLGTDTMVARNSTDTLANKTLTAPVIGAATGTSLAVTGAITSSGTAGIGYATGAGGTVTQGTSRTTTVVLSKLSGKITLFSATLAADTDVSFTWTNTLIAATDVVVFNVVGGAAIKGGYAINCIPGAGSATVTVHNLTPTITATEAPQLQFVVIKAVQA